jgi:nicotinate-nucleotide pyrophosphorylase (carboxylating)
MPGLPDPNTLPLPALYDSFRSTGLIRLLLLTARWEDLGPEWRADAEDVSGAGDITSVVSVSADAVGVADVVFRKGGVVAGLAAVPDVLGMFAPGCSCDFAARDGQEVPAGAIVATLKGPKRQLLAAERTLLNLVARLSGVATRTALFRSVLPAGTKARLYDTRKTTPGMRVLEKYAVRCGGGFCHRLGLHDAVLIKDNHVAGVPARGFAAFVAAAAQRAREMRKTSGLQFVQVEVTTLEQLREVLSLPEGLIDIVLLDNMTPATMREASALRDRQAPGVELEASGGINLETIAEVASTGVDRISVGSLTHGVVSLDVALEMRA